jgi:hypothetical protein
VVVVLVHQMVAQLQIQKVVEGVVLEDYRTSTQTVTTGTTITVTVGDGGAGASIQLLNTNETG